jgi:hypothetical protein
VQSIIAPNVLYISHHNHPMTESLNEVMFQLWSDRPDLLDPKSLHALDFTHTTMTAKLADEICQLPALKHLTLGYVNDCEYLLERIHKTRRLETLVLDHPSFMYGEKSLVLLQEANRTLNSLSLLTTMDIKGALGTESVIQACKLSQLKHLRFKGLRSNVDDIFWASLSRLPMLKKLELREMNIGDEGLAEIGRQSQLEELVLNGRCVWQPRTTAAGYEYLAQLKNLRYLDLSERYDLGADALKAIGKIISLKYLNLYETATTDEGLAYLANLQLLEALDVSRQSHRGHVTDAGVAHIAKLRALQVLRLPDSTGHLTPIAISMLAELPHLRDLRYWLNDKYSDTIIHDELQKLPKLETVGNTCSWDWR